MDQAPPIEVQEYLAAITKGIYDKVEAQQQIFDSRLNGVEQTLAGLLQGYTELAAMVQALVSVIVNKTKEEQEEFFSVLRQGRQDMMDLLRQGMADAERDAGKFVASPPQPDDGDQTPTS